MLNKCILILLLFATAITQLPEDDLVTATFPNYTHNIYSGYLDIGIIQAKKSIHYVLLQSQNNVAKDPVVIWLTGGPGCSSLNAMLLQNGPFVFEPGSHNLTANKHAWNKRANVIYLQVPAGVGYSEGSADSETLNDTITIEEAIVGMRYFFIRFPNLKPNQLYIAGSGYGATLATYLAGEMIQLNQDPFAVYYDKFNIKGILLGNPCMRKDQCYGSGSERSSFYHYEFLAKRAYIPKSKYNEFRAVCSLGFDEFECYQVRVQLDKFFNSTLTSIYNIYDKCYYNNKTQNSINEGCLDEEGITDYLNGEIAREQWNIRESVKQWAPCNKTIWKEYVPNSNLSAYEVLPFLHKNHMRIWVYSGDLDSSVPITGTKKWIEHLKAEELIPIKRNWREWWVPGRHSGEDQVGGNIWQLQKLTFASVKGAGFRAALDKPQAMEQVLNGFLDGKALPQKQEV